MTQILSAAFRLAWFLVSIGFLADATVYVMREAVHAQQHGLINLRALNRALMAPRSHRGLPPPGRVGAYFDSPGHIRYNTSARLHDSDARNADSAL